MEDHGATQRTSTTGFGVKIGMTAEWPPSNVLARIFGSPLAVILVINAGLPIQTQDPLNVAPSFRFFLEEWLIRARYSVLRRRVTLIEPEVLKLHHPSDGRKNGRPPRASRLCMTKKRIFQSRALVRRLETASHTMTAKALFDDTPLNIWFRSE